MSSTQRRNRNLLRKSRPETLSPTSQPEQATTPSRTSSDEDVASPSAQDHEPSTTGRRFVSYRLKGEYEKPWLSDPALKKTRVNNFIVGSLILLGFAGAGVAIFLLSWPYRPGDYCMVFEDSFETLNKDVWSHEVQLDGFGPRSFDWTTTDERNAYVDDEGLHIVPTLTNETTSITSDDLYSGYKLDLFKDGTCTSRKNSSCVMVSDPIQGDMIPPIRSARLSTKGKKSIRYGKVEVVAKLPKGDWIWPAIWMMPERPTYGAWPKSGEIDIMESRGNSRGYPEGGRNLHYSTLHWGPSTMNDAYWRTTGAHKIRRGDYSNGFHTFGVQWTPNYIYFYIDSRVHQMLFIGFKKDEPMYDRGKFADMAENSTMLVNPWADSMSTTGNAPFDQSFYLILNVAVGGRDGWFLDHVGDKPWIDASSNAQWTFWSAADEWLPTWGKGDSRGMTVKSVKMWQAGKCGASREL
jgi:beta-glucanase (GH16 family)